MLIPWLFSAALAAEPCTTHLPATPHRQPDGPRCLAAAAATALSTWEGAPDARAIARAVQVLPDGIDPFDLQRAVQALGWNSLVFTGPPEAAARLIEAGFATVAFVDEVGSRRHAITVTGARRVAGEDGRCTTALAALQVYDPRTDVTRWQSAKAFAARQSVEQLIVFFRPEEREQLDDAGFPLPPAEAVDRRFRSQALVHRAQAHQAPNTQSIRLLQQAVEADPSYEKAQVNLAQHQRATAGSD